MATVVNPTYLPARRENPLGKGIQQMAEFLLKRSLKDRDFENQLKILAEKHRHERETKEMERKIAEARARALAGAITGNFPGPEGAPDRPSIAKPISIFDELEPSGGFLRSDESPFGGSFGDFDNIEAYEQADQVTGLQASYPEDISRNLPDLANLEPQDILPTVNYIMNARQKALENQRAARTEVREDVRLGLAKKEDIRATERFEFDVEKGTDISVRTRLGELRPARFRTEREWKTNDLKGYEAARRQVEEEELREKRAGVQPVEDKYIGELPGFRNTIDIRTGSPVDPLMKLSEAKAKGIPLREVSDREKQALNRHSQMMSEISMLFGMLRGDVSGRPIIMAETTAEALQERAVLWTAGKVRGSSPYATYLANVKKSSRQYARAIGAEQGVFTNQDTKDFEGLFGAAGDTRNVIDLKEILLVDFAEFNRKLYLRQLGGEVLTKDQVQKERREWFKNAHEAVKLRRRQDMMKEGLPIEPEEGEIVDINGKRYRWKNGEFEEAK